MNKPIAPESREIDGTKVKAWNARDKTYTKDNVDKRIKEMDEKVDSYLKEIEGMNSKIATIQKMAYGFRNKEHFKTAIYFHCGNLQLYPEIHTNVA